MERKRKWNDEERRMMKEKKISKKEKNDLNIEINQ